MTDETAWNDHHEEPGVRRGAWEYPPRIQPEYRAVWEEPAVQGMISRQVSQEVTARKLGREHGRAGTTPYGDLDFDDDSALMAALGETSPTTEDNHPRRLALLEAYRDAYQQAREGTRA